MPEGYLHKLEWVTGVEKVPERANFALAFKAIDTVGKPGVEPADFYSPGVPDCRHHSSPGKNGKHRPGHCQCGRVLPAVVGL